ncbi:MAG: transporter substrate-binding domain-containing protein [Alphaproteobacteria bacterium]|nr:transporter substrate-binding domain-containing protein [Alphaproteobacteria bacterium]
MLLRAICLCLSLIFLVACGEKKAQDAQKPLIVITSPDSPPFEFKDTARGGDQVIGFDMDVAHKLGEYLGRPVKIVEADFSSLIPSLHSGRADMAIAYLSATDERRKSIDFSEPYYATALALLVPEGSPINSEKDLEGKRLGAQLGSANETLAHQWAKEFPGLSVVSLNKVGDLVQELKSGRLEAVVAEDIVVKKVVAANPGLKVVNLKVTGDPLSIAFPKGSPLVAPTNEALKKMKGDIQEFTSKWLLD